MTKSRACRNTLEVSLVAGRCGPQRARGGGREHVLERLPFNERSQESGPRSTRRAGSHVAVCFFHLKGKV